MFPILKTDKFILWFLYKSDSCIFCFRNDGEMKVTKVHRTYHSLNGGLLKIPHVFHLSIIASYNKKYFKISLLPLTKKVSLKSFNKKRFHLYFSPLEAYTTWAQFLGRATIWSNHSQTMVTLYQSTVDR